jgi:hypothetical protein
VTWRNRVTPFGDIVAVAARGTLMGNRGVLHNAERSIVRDSQVKRWIACRLEFRARHRVVMTPGRWTELFFLDEATALAAGHRPCAECRNADYRAFQSAWRRAFPDADVSADAMDLVLHQERRVRPWIKRTHHASADDLPDGAFVTLDGKAWLVRGGRLLEWTPAGYGSRRERPRNSQLSLLTPPSIVAVLRAGYVAGIHAGASD